MTPRAGQNWKKGRGKLGIFEPLIGRWIVRTDSERGPMTCEREFSRTLGGKFVELRAVWTFTASSYEETCLFGVGDDKKIAFWSFTSDGKRSNGELTDTSDVDPQAFGFESKMPAGLARQIYWPHPDDGFLWAVESRNKKGFRRFVEHHYQRA